MNIKTTLVWMVSFVIPFLLGTIAGHYHGKSQVYEGFYKNADHMVINPITMEKMK